MYRITRLRNTQTVRVDPKLAGRRVRVTVGERATGARFRSTTTKRRYESVIEGSRIVE